MTHSNDPDYRQQEENHDRLMAEIARHEAIEQERLASYENDTLDQDGPAVAPQRPTLPRPSHPYRSPRRR
ncbi:hypothetical protein JGS22_015015 [Streptomyces sp. P38-E01]|uniref:Uncharacterized protein n=1 Tax=Streptomyces tardus TaxID=2780544 RepID=A0A949JHT8_9ACTN|nr:hypothetical protein [Streptomyces tardus]MBU7598890.1 hypothetical protein [Streptomyces tardus]